MERKVVSVPTTTLGNERVSIGKAGTQESRPLSSYFFLLPFYFLLSLCADHPLCAAPFCSARLGRCDFTFACFALPRRHCSPASPTLGRKPKCLDDQFLGRFLSLLHVPAFLLGRRQPFATR